MTADERNLVEAQANLRCAIGLIQSAVWLMLRHTQLGSESAATVSANSALQSAVTAHSMLSLMVAEHIKEYVDGAIKGLPQQATPNDNKPLT